MFKGSLWKSEKEYEMRIYFKIAFSACLALVLFPLRIFKVRTDRIVFAGLTGGTTYEYSCNPKYICEYMIRHMPGKFKICWIVTDPSRYGSEKRQGIRFRRHYSLRSFYHLMTAKVVVTNGSYAPWVPFRKQQYLINTWHGGGAYKKIENDKPDANWATQKRAEFCAGNISLFLSSCTKATELLVRGAFCYRGEVMELGLPRNDDLVTGETGDSWKLVRERYGIGMDEKIVLYAPTYRNPSKDVVLDGKKLLEELSAGGVQWHLLFRAHRYQDEHMRIRVEGGNYIDVSGYPDMQELLCAADMLITDYSSAIWDYSFLKRPCFLYVPDLKEYLDKTGFYVDIHQWPFSMAVDCDELISLIRNYDEEIMCKKIKEHHQLMGSRESGHACESVVKRILDVCEEKLC